MTDTYLFHQTPPAVAAALVATLPVSEGDVWAEPFRGEGSFYNAFPEGVVKVWAELREGRDYTTLEEMDWCVTNPPFRLETESGRVNAVWSLLDYYTKKARKGVAFLVNEYGFCTLTPPRIKILRARGWGLTALHVCAVPKWRGRYYFMVWEKDKRGFLTEV